jgi:uncharacterized protein YecE (DUF72 family)
MIRVGIGGWTYEPWRGVFYPPKLKHADELGYASRKLTSIEINGTFYRAQKPESFRQWAQATPDGFVFSLKASRYSTHRRVLAEAAPSVERFLNSGIVELGDKLGPILWQMPPTTTFREDDFAAFLKLLPATHEGRRLRHAVEVRHKSFCTGEFVALLRAHNVAVVYVESGKHTPIADVTADFIYARLQGTVAEEPTGYPPAELERWVKRVRAWEKGESPKDLPPLLAPAVPGSSPRDCFIYFISGAKERAPAAAMAMIERLK